MLGSTWSEAFQRGGQVNHGLQLFRKRRGFAHHRLSHLSSALALNVMTDEFTERPLPGVNQELRQFH